MIEPEPIRDAERWARRRSRRVPAVPPEREPFDFDGFMSMMDRSIRESERFNAELEGWIERLSPRTAEELRAGTVRGASRSSKARRGVGKHTVEITERAREVLGRSTITQDRVTLPEGDLGRELYDEVNKALLAAGGKWSRKERAHLFTRDPREALGLAVETGRAEKIQAKLQAFYTPPELARKVVELAEIDSHGLRILEPSAGEGALIRAAIERGYRADYVALDTDDHAIARLLALRHERKTSVTSFDVRRTDFLTAEASVPRGHALDLGKFDRVLMNPPFTAGQDALHVLTGLRHVKPGGVLVAITSPSVFASKARISGWAGEGARHNGQKAGETLLVIFNQLYEDGNAEHEDVPAGAFKSSGTNVATKILKFNVPEDVRPEWQA